MGQRPWAALTRRPGRGRAGGSRRRGARTRAARIARAVLAGALVVVSACSFADRRPHDGQLEQARDAFLAGDYERARDLFRSVGPRGSDPLAASLGVARSEQQLHHYTAALTRYRRVLQERPDDALAWRGYLATLYADGMRRGDDDVLARVLDLAPEALSAAPDEVELYPTLLQTAAALDRLDGYAEVLDGALAEQPDHPVLRVERERVRMYRRQTDDPAGGAREAEQGSGGARGPARAEAALDALIDEHDGRSDASAAELYALAAAHDLLRRPQQVDAALQRLERAAGGRAMAAPMRYRQFLGEWVRNVDAPAVERIALAERWLDRFTPRWQDDPARYRAILGMQFDVMVAAAQAQLDGGGELPEKDAERITAAGRRLARIDTDYGAQRYVQTVGLLAAVPSQYVAAVRVADDGIAALRADRPGLLHPAIPAGEREAVRRGFLQQLLRLQATALRNLGRTDEADAALREAEAVAAEGQTGQ